MRFRTLPPITLLVAICACQSYVAVPVQPATLVAVGQRSQVKVTTKADILFVIDDSLSMSGKQDRLAAALADFTSALDSLTPPVDYQVAVITTSIFERFGACGPNGDPNAAAQCDSDWTATGFACQTNACVRDFPDESGKLRQVPGAPSPVLRRADTTAAQFSAWIARAVQAGVNGARQPQGFEAMKLAIKDPQNGLVRNDAKVVVAFFSDAEDCSDPSQKFSMLVKDSNGNIVDQCARDAASDGSGVSSLEPVSRYVNFLRTLTNADGSAKEVEVASIVSLKDGTAEPGRCTNAGCVASCDQPPAQQACATRCTGAAPLDQCLADCNAQCKEFCGGEVPGRRYVDMATAFSGVVANICGDDASTPLRRLAGVIGIPKEVQLYAKPTPIEALRVTVLRGSATIDCEQGQGFNLVQTNDGTAVQFAGTCLLQPDDQWDVRYLTNG